MAKSKSTSAYLLICGIIFGIIILANSALADDDPADSTILTEIEESRDSGGSDWQRAKEKEQVFKAYEAFFGEYSLVEQGAGDGLSQVYSMQLDFNDSTCELPDNIDDDLMGWCGTMMQYPEIWVAVKASMKEDMKTVVVTMENVYCPLAESVVGNTCQVELKLVSDGSVIMSYIDGLDAPSVLLDGRNEYTKKAVFKLDK